VLMELAETLTLQLYLLSMSIISRQAIRIAPSETPRRTT